jgi:hypothetical protein
MDYKVEGLDMQNYTLNLNAPRAPETEPRQVLLEADINVTANHLHEINHVAYFNNTLFTDTPEWKLWKFCKLMGTRPPQDLLRKLGINENEIGAFLDDTKEPDTNITG